MTTLKTLYGIIFVLIWAVVGYIRDEYETMQELYKPYVKLGGNGSGTKIMKEIENLPIRDK